MKDDNKTKTLKRETIEYMFNNKSFLKIKNLVSDGVIVAVVSRGSSEDPELALVECRGSPVDRIHLWNLLPLVRHAGHQLPAVGVRPPES